MARHNSGGRGRYNRNQGSKYLRRNERIRAREVRVIGPDGKNYGIMAPRDAVKIAKEAGLDLIEVSPSARPPVCRILDYGKFLYEESKKKKDSKPVSSKLKEVKFRTSIDPHDFETKLRRAEEFLYHGNKVKVTLSFRGRENQHKDLGFERVKQAIEMLKQVATPDADPKLVGRNVTLILSPLPANKRKLVFNRQEELESRDPDDEQPDDSDEE